jgi:hypothetical protein
MKASRSHLIDALGRASRETRAEIVSALAASGNDALLAQIAAEPAVPLQSIAGGKPAPAAPFQPSKGGSFHIEDAAFGDLDLTPEPDGRWRAFHMSWHGDHAGHVGAGIFAHRLDGLLAVLRFAHDATADRLSRQPKPSHPNNFSPDGSAA